MHPDTTSGGLPLTTCVVLVDAGRPLDDALRADLEGRAWRVSTHHDAVRAMTELCLRLRTGHDAERSEPVAPALVVIDPDAWGTWPAMQRALRRYLPQIAVLEQRNGTLAQVHAPAPRPPAAPAPRRPAQPDGDDDAQPAGITRDELDMLLRGGTGA